MSWAEQAPVPGDRRFVPDELLGVAPRRSGVADGLCSDALHKDLADCQDAETQRRLQSWTWERRLACGQTQTLLLGVADTRCLWEENRLLLGPMRFLERIVRISKRIGSWRAPLVFGAFALSLAAYALILADAQAASSVLTRAVAPLVYRLTVAGLAACAACMVIARTESAFRSLLGASLGATLFLILFYLLRVETVALLTLSNVLWAFIYEAYPAGAILSCAVAVALPAAGLLAHAYGAVTAAAIMMVCAAAAMFGFLLIRSREKIIALQTYINRLEENVASLTRANILSQDYAKDIELESRTRERDRLTRDIHDAIGYTLTNTVMMVEAIKVMVRTEPAQVPSQIKRIRAHVEEGLAHIRKTLREFRAREKEEESVYWAVKKLVKVFTISTGLQVRYEMGNARISDLERFPDAVYHFIQEGLINAFRHGHASRVIIMFWDYGDLLRIMLDDDGTGCPTDVAPGIGIAGMQERAALVGGSVSIDPAETGFRISMYLPVEKEHGDQDQAPDRR
jgi:signal transduction histidine kinase